MTAALAMEKWIRQWRTLGLLAAAAGLDAQGPPVDYAPAAQPLEIRESAALPLRLSQSREEFDGYIVETMELRGDGFALTIPGDEYWKWTVEGGTTARGTRLGVGEATFSVAVFAAADVFPERPLDPQKLLGYLEGFRLEWERRDRRAFTIFLNTSAEEGALLRATGPVIYDQYGNPRGNAGRLRREKLWGYPFHQLGYQRSEMVEVENAESGETEWQEVVTRHLEWWIEAPEWTARARFVTTGAEPPEGLQGVVENQLRAILFTPLAEERGNGAPE